MPCSRETRGSYPSSSRAKEILDNWEQARTKFVKVMPNEYKRALNEMAAAENKEAA